MDVQKCTVRNVRFETAIRTPGAFCEQDKRVAILQLGGRERVRGMGGRIEKRGRVREGKEGWGEERDR